MTMLPNDVAIIFLLAAAVHLILGNSYVFKHEFARLAYENPKYIKVTSFNFHKANRTYMGLDVDADLEVDVSEDDDFMILITLFHFKSNEYKKTPFYIKQYLCKEILAKKNLNLFDNKQILHNSNINRCPIKKGKIFIKDVSPSTEGWPDHLPAGKWMVEISFDAKAGRLITVQWFTQVIPKNKM